MQCGESRHGASLVETRGFDATDVACALLVLDIMLAMVATMTERVRAAGEDMHDLVRIATGMSIVGLVFLIAQTLLFLEELWWHA